MTLTHYEKRQRGELRERKLRVKDPELKAKQWKKTKMKGSSRVLEECESICSLQFCLQEVPLVTQMAAFTEGFLLHFSKAYKLLIPSFMCGKLWFLLLLGSRMVSSLVFIRVDRKFAAGWMQTVTFWRINFISDSVYILRLCFQPQK